MKIKGKVFLLDDDELIVAMLSRALTKAGYKVQAETDTDGVVHKIKTFAPDVVMLDIRMPQRNGMDILEDLISNEVNTQIVMLTADDTAETAVKAMKIGAADYLTKPFNTDEVKIVLNNIIEKEHLKQEVTYLRKAYSEFVEKDLVGKSPAIQELLSKIKKMAQARVSNILITGESGTGKEVAARYIHNLMYGTDTSRHAPFITVNCAAMPESLLESELFGHEKGSFTDARSNKKGLFEVAEGGSLLLDEIGDMKLDLQSKLLRVLEDRTIRHIGGKREISVNLTTIATTSRNLSEAVKNGDFRKDLFFRLSPFYLHIVPLRERNDDIPLLTEHFLSHFGAKYNKKTIKGFSPDAEKLLVDYSWPGNVRELKNLVERFVVLENTEIVQPEHLPNWLFSQTMAVDQQPSNNQFKLPESGISLEEVEKNLILQALEKANNNKTLAAKLLNISYDSLRYQVKKYGLE
jgi:DNA-binding NtrC family response regulator